jgi:hypothetical protein
VFALAEALIPKEKGDLMSVKPEVDLLIKSLEEPFKVSVQEALLLGSALVPALEATLLIMKQRTPKKQSA